MSNEAEEQKKKQRCHDMPVRSDVLVLFTQIPGKNLEVRSCIPRWLEIQPNDIVFLSPKVGAHILSIRRYPDWNDVVRREDCGQIWPGHTPQQIRDQLMTIYRPALLKRGLLVFEFKVFQRNR